MSDELEIVLKSQLEADEEQSAQRIAKQLPSISQKINERSTIKVGVELDTASVKTGAQQITKTMRNIQTQDVGVRLNITNDAKSMLSDAMRGMDVSGSLTTAMTRNLENMAVQIDAIHASWVKAKDTKERLLQLEIAGTDQEGRSVKMLQSYNDEGRKVEETVKDITLNLDQQRKKQDQIEKQAAKNADARAAAMTQYLDELKDVQSVYSGMSSAKGITNVDAKKALDAQYARAYEAIQNMGSSNGKVLEAERASVESVINALKRMVREYQNAEYAATKLRAKNVSDIKVEQGGKLDAFQRKLETAGVLTDEFKSKIEGLRGELDGIGQGDRDALTAYLNEFDQLKSKVDAFKAGVQQTNQMFSELSSYTAKATSIQAKMVGLDRNSAEYAGLRNELAGCLEQIGKIKTEIGNQVSMNKINLDYVSGYSKYLADAEAQERRLATETASVSDRARDAEAAMNGWRTTLSDMEGRFRQIIEPSQTLVANMEALRNAEDAFNKANTDQEKVTAYEKIRNLLAACKSEMTALGRVQRTDLNEFKFAENLAKAKADLNTVGRQWSALFQNSELKATFYELKNGLSGINNQMDLRKWTTQFSAFKSEVKAAGANVQSLNDVLKANAGKVLEWITATTVLFRAFGLLKTGVTNVIALDTAMIDLRKTTTATNGEYEKFYRTANDTARALGSTTEAVISQTAEWSRLGYSLKEASELAKNSSVFAAVSPGMDQAVATDGLVSIIKAFDIDVDDAMDGIISKVNAVGNAFAVSNSDIVEALQRSSSAMAAANNTFDETVALATAAIEITRDASSVGVRNRPALWQHSSKLVAISVKGQRWSRPSKDLVVYLFCTSWVRCRFFI